MCGSQVVRASSVKYFLCDADWGWPLDLLNRVARCLHGSSLKQEPVLWQGKWD